MRRRNVTLVAAALVVLAAGVAAGCGSQGTASPSPQTVVGTLPKETTPTTPAVKGDPAAGKTVFASAGCTGCHTLKAANAHGTVGPNLDQKKPALGLIIDRVTHGKGVMPAFAGQLSAKQIADVAAFVYQSTHS